MPLYIIELLFEDNSKNQYISCPKPNILPPKPEFLDDSCLIYYVNYIGVPIRFPPPNSPKRPNCKRMTLNGEPTYWVRRETDPEKNFANFYACEGKSFKKTIQISSVTVPIQRKYTDQIAWVRCGPGIIDQVHFWNAPATFGNRNNWFDGCGVTTELIRICLDDPTLNMADGSILSKLLKTDRKWMTSQKQHNTDRTTPNTDTTLTTGQWLKFRDALLDKQTDKLLPNVCKHMVGMIVEARLVEEESNGLITILEAVKISNMGQLFFKSFENPHPSGRYDLKTVYKWISVSNLKKKYKPKKEKLGKFIVVTNSEEEKAGVTGKFFFCSTGKEFQKKIRLANIGFEIIT